MNNMNAFITFIREQGIVGLAIGFIMGGAIGKVISSLVADIVQPIIGLVLGSRLGLAAMALGPIHYGSFLSNLIDFVIVAAVVFFVFRGLKLDKIDSKKP